MCLFSIKFHVTEALSNTDSHIHIVSSLVFSFMFFKKKSSKSHTLPAYNKSRLYTVLYLLFLDCVGCTPRGLKSQSRQGCDACLSTIFLSDDSEFDRLIESQNKNRDTAYSTIKRNGKSPTPVQRETADTVDSPVSREWLHFLLIIGLADAGTTLSKCGYDFFVHMSAPCDHLQLIRPNKDRFYGSITSIVD